MHFIFSSATFFCDRRMKGDSLGAEARIISVGTWFTAANQIQDTRGKRESIKKNTLIQESWHWPKLLQGDICHLRWEKYTSIDTFWTCSSLGKRLDSTQHKETALWFYSLVSSATQDELCSCVHRMNMRTVQFLNLNSEAVI